MGLTWPCGLQWASSAPGSVSSSSQDESGLRRICRYRRRRRGSISYPAWLLRRFERWQRIRQPPLRRSSSTNFFVASSTTLAAARFFWLPLGILSKTRLRCTGNATFSRSPFRIFTERGVVHPSVFKSLLTVMLLTLFMTANAMRTDAITTTIATNISELCLRNQCVHI